MFNSQSVTELNFYLNHLHSQHPKYTSQFFCFVYFKCKLVRENKKLCNLEPKSLHTKF